MPSTLLPLKDYHLPAATHFWPLAPGWWLLLGLLVVAMLVGLHWVKKHKAAKQKDYRTEASQLLEGFVCEFQTHNNSQQLAMQINTLLKRIAVSALSPTASRLTDEQWVEFLDAKLPQPGKLLEPTTQQFISLQPYSAHPLLDDAELAKSLRAIAYWIQQHQGES